MVLVILTAFLCSCQSLEIEVFDQLPAPVEEIPDGLSEDEATTLASLEQIDEFPLYTMTYHGEYTGFGESAAAESYQEAPPRSCSLFAAYGDQEDVIFGRNFDWDFSPALLLYMDPPEAYASVSMVDIYYLGFGGEEAFGIADLPLEERIGLLEAPELPFDGINEAGLVVGMAAVPNGGIVMDPEKETIDSVMVIRKILDHAATIEEALEIFREFNIEMYDHYIHYLIAEESGRSVLVEFSRGEMVVIPNQENWQIATNFLLSEAKTDYGIHCGRYETIEDKLINIEGKLGPSQAMDLLEDVAQSSTQWSAVYRVSAGEIWIVMGSDYNQVHKIKNGFD